MCLRAISIGKPKVFDRICGSARCDLNPTDKYLLRSYSLDPIEVIGDTFDPSFIEKDSLFLNEVTKEDLIQIKTTIENLHLLNEINHSLGLQSKWITYSASFARCFLMLEERYLLDGYVLDPMKREFNWLTLRHDTMSKETILKIKSSIEAQITARLSRSRSVLENAMNGLSSHCSLLDDDDKYIASLPSFATNPYLFNYDDEVHEDPSDQAEESIKSNCNN